MNITGERQLAVDRQAAWESLFDPAILRQCIPGCESVEREDETRYRAVVVMAIGPVKARFSGTFTIADAQAPVRCRLVFEGSGGAAGLAKGGADVVLDPADGGTRLAYDAQAQVAGKLAQVGARLIEGVARKLAGEFFDRFETAVTAGQT